MDQLSEERLVLFLKTVTFQMFLSAVPSPWMQQQKAAERRVEALPSDAECSRKHRGVMSISEHCRTQLCPQPCPCSSAL